MSKTAREVMTPGDAWPGSQFGVDEGAQVLRSGRDVRVGGPGEFAGPVQTHAIGADDWVDRALATMTELKVHRLPVVDRGRLVGSVSQGDLASSIERPETWSWLCK
jgi:CBS domain-containing protein